MIFYPSGEVPVWHTVALQALVVAEVNILFARRFSVRRQPENCMGGIH